MRFRAPAPAPARERAAGDLDHRADGDRGAEGDDQPRPRVVLEGPAADAADEERVQRPDGRGDGGRDGETPARVPGEPAGEGHRGAAAGNEPADDDELRAEPLQRPLGPRPGLHSLRGGEEPALHGRAETASEEVAEVVADEGARGRAADEQGDARVGAPRGGNAEGDDHGLAGQCREDRVKRRNDEGDQVRQRRVDLEAAEGAHRRPAPVPTEPVPIVPMPAGAGAGPVTASAQRTQYRHSGTAASSASGIGVLHCSHRPNTPAATRPSASSVSASRWRAATARRSSRRACLSSALSEAAAW
jgi:hypothetical protein